MLTANLGKPLSRIPDPFNAGFASFAHHNNAMLRDFLDRYRLRLRIRCRERPLQFGRFRRSAGASPADTMARIMDIMLPTLRAERQATYSPVLPISAKSGVVLQVPVEVVDADTGIVRFEDEGETVEQMRLRRQGQAAVEGRLGDALVRARRRLRDVRQGPDRQRHPVRPDRPRARRANARRT